MELQQPFANTKEKLRQFQWVRTAATYLQISYYVKKIILFVSAMVKWAYFYFWAEHFPKRYKYQVQNYTFRVLKPSRWKWESNRHFIYSTFGWCRAWLFSCFSSCYFLDYKGIEQSFINSDSEWIVCFRVTKEEKVCPPSQRKES